MRGDDQQTGFMFSYLSPEERVAMDRPLRTIRRLTDAALAELAPQFETMYSDIARPSIPPEQLLRALLLQLLYSVRSERLLMEQLDYNLLFRWFVGLSMDAPVWNHSTFSKNRDRLLEADLARAFFAAIVRQAGEAGVLSTEHFTVDGTLLDAWASQKSFQRKDRPTPPSDPSGGSNPTIRFKGEPRRNDTHASTTDPDARLYKKASGQEAKLAYLGHAVAENRHGLLVDVMATTATGTAEREAALVMLSDLPLTGRITVGADTNFDTRDFVGVNRALGITAHVAQFPPILRRGSALMGGRRGTPATGAVNVLKGRQHVNFELLLHYTASGDNVALVGPAGSGKTTACKNVADALGLRFFPKSVGPSTDEFQMNGFLGATGDYVAGLVREPFENGGVLLLDEMDKAHPAVLTILNTILDNGWFMFPDGALIERHTHFRCVAGMNTYGNGAKPMWPN